ncbi:uncharacterized protein TNCV_86601 [Trichonephila clavipes]|nr:uncharacterized protein TNCV_86601 [Trichonephila clavipes]
MPVLSDPCSCQSDCLVCGRGEEPPHDCAIQVVLESKVFQERMLHGEPTEAKLEEILKNGKEYLPLAMHMTDKNSARWQTMYNYDKSGFPQHQENSSRNVRKSIKKFYSLPLQFIHSQCFSKSHHVVLKILLPHQHYSLAAMVGKDGKLYFRLVDVGALLYRSKVYKFAKRLESLVIQGKDVLPPHKQYPIMTQKSKLVTPDVVFNISNAELSSLATSFAISLNASSALVENPSNLFVESYKTSPVLHVQDSPAPKSILMVYEACLSAKATPSVAKRLSLPERPAEPQRMPPAEPLRMLPAEPQRMPPAKPHRMPPAEPQRMPPAEPEIPAESERPPMEMVALYVSVNTVEVTPPLIIRCDKSTQTIFRYLHVKRHDLGKRRMEKPQTNKRLKKEPSEVSNNIVLWVPGNHPLMKLGNNGFIIQPTNVNGINK